MTENQYKSVLPNLVILTTLAQVDGCSESPFLVVLSSTSDDVITETSGAQFSAALRRRREKEAARAVGRAPDPEKCARHA